MSSIVWFDEADATTLERVGGKGANLGRMSAAGFPVPQGFVVTTDAYSEHVAGMRDALGAALDAVDFAQAQAVEAASARIRAAIAAAQIPAGVASDVATAYGQLADEPAYVAVRSSGTAEDLAEASFAGLHDTFLDVRGIDAVSCALKECWSSMWTARAIAYRHNKGIDHARARIAVVIQTMVESEVAGVMFTGNPLTAATDEFVINASWGLGEAVVSGVVTPDQFTVAAADGRVLERELGGKQVRFVRDPSAGTGTAEETVPEEDRERFCLSEEQVAELATIGRTVQDTYGGLPQDIEWGYAGGQFYLLQARPITGVEFSWDADVDAWQTHEFARETTWTRAWADSNWTGAKTPLFYSLRAYSMTRGETTTNRRRGLDSAAAKPYLRYHKAEVYYNCDLDREVVTGTTPKMFRPLLPDLNFIPPAWQEQVLSAELNPLKLLEQHLRIAFGGGQHAQHNAMVRCREYIADDAWHPRNLPDLRSLSDGELIEMVTHFNETEAVYCEDVWFFFLQHARDALCLLPILLGQWYQGDPLIIHDLLAGTIRPSRTLIDNAALWGLSEQVRGSELLRTTLERHEGPAFFRALEDSDEGRAFLAAYDEFLTDSGFRGHADRDIIFPRRIEDPWIDYRNFKALLTVENPVHPQVREQEVNARRDAAVSAVVAQLETQPLGHLRAGVFKQLIDFIHDFIVLRDDQRWSLDRLTLSTKLVLEELARRARDRGLLHGRQDHFFLTAAEFYELLAGRASQPLVEAKIAARRANWERNEHKQANLPLFMQRGLPIDVGLPQAVDGDGPLQGIPTSRGTISGTARIVRTLTEIGRVKAGEILVCNSTDPGWTPVFVVVAGVVTETGGMLSHASCLSREYGLPSVQVADAIQRIPDGAWITVRGDLGQVEIHDRTNPDPDGTKVESVALMTEPELQALG
jgi:rifampicin phosphotransferase